MSTKPLEILLVEDNKGDIGLITEFFSDAKVITNIHIAEDGEEALDYLYKRGKFANENGNPAIILLDIKMPKMSGIEVLKHIRSDPKFKLIPVIMVTSSREERDLVESYKLGANSYVVKPVDIIQFIDAMKIVGQYWAVINQPPPISV